MMKKKKESVININTKTTFENGSTIETIETQLDKTRRCKAKCLLLKALNRFDNLKDYNKKELEEMVDRILYVSSSRNKNEKGK